MSPETSVVAGEETEGDISLFSDAENVSRVAEYHAFVAQNAEVMVESDRAPGYKAPFGVLMGLCAAEITQENVEMFFAEARAMLARAANQTADKKIDKAEADEEKIAQSVQKVEKKADDQTSENAQGRQALNPKPNSLEIKEPQIQNTPNQAVTLGSHPSAPADSIDDYSGERRDLAGSPVEKAPHKSTQEIRSAKTIVNNPAAAIMPVETAAHQQVAKEPDTKLGKAASPKTIETKPDSKEQDDKILQVDEEYEIQNLEIEIYQTDFENEDDMLEVSQLNQILPADERLWETPEELFALKMLELQAYEHEAVPYYQEFELPEYAQTDWETTVELSLPVESVEQTLLLVDERLRAMEAEEAETAKLILVELLKKVIEAESLLESSEIILESKAVEPELTESFVKLFEYVGIEYTPSLIDSCIKLALTRDVRELIEKIATNNGVPPAQGQATHEVIKYLLSAIGTIKKAAQQAYRIGKSVLNLYLQQLHVDKA